MPYMSANSDFGLAVEAVYGTAASVSTYMPIGSPKVSPTLVWLDDSDFRGSPVMHYDQVPGVRHDMFSGKVFMFTDVYPNLLRAALGGTDTVTKSGSASIHTIPLINSPSTGSQAPSYTIVNNSVDNQYVITACRLVDMSITFAAAAAVETTFNFTGNISTITGASVVNESTQHFVPAWNCSASLGGVNVTVVESAQLDIKRNTAPIFTLGGQGPYNNFQGPIEVSGSLVFVVEASETNYANALTRDQQQLYLLFTDPVTNNYVSFQMSAIQLEDPVIDQSKPYVTLQSKFTAVANTTDQTGTGYSPLLVTIKNNTSTPY